MAANLGYAWANSINYGVNPANSLGVAVSTSGTAGTAGAWKEITSFANGAPNTSGLLADIGWVELDFNTLTITTAQVMTVDISIGASGSQIVVLSSLVLQTFAASQIFKLPLPVAAGTKIWARVNSPASSADNLYCSLRGYQKSMGAMRGWGCCKYDTYGVAVTSGTAGGKAVTAGATANQLGTYAAITASLTNDICGFFITFDNQNKGNPPAANFLMNIAIGPGNTTILPNIAFGGGVNPPASSGFIPMPIRSGTRVSAALQSDTGTGTVIGVGLYGLRQ